MSPNLVLFGFSRAMQLGFVVDDLDMALESWTQVLRVGPFLRPPGTQQVEAIYRGKPSAPQLEVAWSFAGDTQIALIRQLNDAPTPYRGVQGLDHLGFWVYDVDSAGAALERQGLAPCYDVTAKGDTVRYYDPPPGLATRISLMRQTPARTRLYATLKRWAQDWDGSDPVRASVEGYPA